jgi:hypothetical protein
MALFWYVTRVVGVKMVFGMSTAARQIINKARTQNFGSLFTLQRKKKGHGISENTAYSHM